MERTLAPNKVTETPMNTPSTGNRNLTASAEIDQACEHFETAQRSGNSLTIETVLRQASPAVDSSTLLRELIAVEIDLCRERGAGPKATDYLSRFPDCRSWIVQLLHNESSERNIIAARATVMPSSSHVSVPGFEIIEEIGRGGMAVVYKAVDLRLKRFVALKLIHQHFRNSRLNQKHFQREATSIAQLKHPGIVQIYGIDEHEGQPYLILELVNGRSLRECLDDRPQAVGWSADLIAKVARAVDHGHQRGVVHRDLKPSNILLTEPPGASDASHAGSEDLLGPEPEAAFGNAAPFPVVADFGFAKQLYASETISGAGVLFGTPDYMPPEQSEGRSFEATPASDIYSLGAMLYELLSGRPPLVGDTPLATVRLIGRAAPVPLRRVVPHVPGWLEAICQRCLEKSPEKRPRSAALLADQLERGIQRAGLSRCRGGGLETGRRPLASLLGKPFSAVGDWISAFPSPRRNPRRAA